MGSDGVVVHSPRLDDPPRLGKRREGHAHDGRTAADMLSGFAPGQILLGDRAYDSDGLRKAVAEQGAWANFKPLGHRINVQAFSAFLYRYRNLIERFFNSRP